MIENAHTVSHLVALVMNQGVPGGNENIKPVVWDRVDGLHFELVLAHRANQVLGQIAKPYKDEAELFTQIMEANRRWGYPTAEALVAAFPKEGRLRQ